METRLGVRLAKRCECHATATSPSVSVPTHEFKRGGPNHPTNGIALSKTAHWLFDRGYWSISDDYEVLVNSDRFDEAGDAGYLLKSRAGRPILLPSRWQVLLPRLRAGGRRMECEQSVE
jgi:hypothetical protein